MQEPLAFSISEAVKATGGALSRTALYKAAQRGEIPIKKYGKRSCVLFADLKRFLESLPSAEKSKAA